VLLFWWRRDCHEQRFNVRTDKQYTFLRREIVWVCCRRHLVATVTVEGAKARQPAQDTSPVSGEESGNVWRFVLFSLFDAGHF
jgi:hypothetical protein